MGARLYSPGIGAFTSLDTTAGQAQDPRSMNRFLYAEANPATLVDPTGHMAMNVEADAGMPTDRLNARQDGYRRRWQVRLGGRNGVGGADAADDARARAHQRVSAFNKTANRRTGEDAQNQRAAANEAYATATAKADDAREASAQVSVSSGFTGYGCATVRCQMRGQCEASAPNPGKDCGVYDWLQDSNLDRPAVDASPNLLVPLVLGSPLLLAGCLFGGCQAAAIAGGIGAGAYTAAVGVSNVPRIWSKVSSGQSWDPLDDGLHNWDPGDAAISAATGVVGGPITGAMKGIGGRVLANGALGAGSTDVSDFYHTGHVSAGDVALGGFVGQFGAIPVTGRATIQAAKGFGLGTGQGAFQTWGAGLPPVHYLNQYQWP
jgi:hypothetical protein